MEGGGALSRIDPAEPEDSGFLWVGRGDPPPS